RRVIEYAVYDKAALMKQATPTDAEITAQYAHDKDKYAPKDMRSLTQVIAPDQAKATALADKVKSGESIGAAAKALGLDAIKISNMERGSYSDQHGSAVADAVFALHAGGNTTPVKSPLGWYVVHVDSITHDPGKTLDEARPEIVKLLAAGKLDAVFADLQNKLSQQADKGLSFADIVKANPGNDVVTTPSIIATGINPDDPKYSSLKDMAPVLKDAFKPDSKVSGEPLIVPYGQTRDKFAFYHVKEITPAGPIPFTKIHDQVAHDALLEAQSKVAHQVALAIAAKADKGTDIAKAAQESGYQLPHVGSITASKIDLMTQRVQAAKPVVELFNTALHHARVLEGERNGGWFIVWLDKRTPGDLSKHPEASAFVQQQLAAGYGQELGEEFASAAKASVGVKMYPGNIAALKNTLSGNNAQ
ncbi:MAG: peptidyl-prolyl cis-trans isomerase, partial [Alphaproteobacteria bacterium]|nr:peptidyl-prolyl cis-trans isomerase [Alphaproteobacteria bacterium]